MNTLTQTQTVVHFINRVLKSTTWGLLAWLLFPVLCAESVKVQASPPPGHAAFKPAPVATKPDIDWFAQVPHLRETSVEAEDSPDEESMAADGTVAAIAAEMGASISHEASDLAADYHLSWESDFSVFPEETAQINNTIAQANSTEIDPSGELDEGTETDLARQSQNPVANLISLPFQNNTNFGVGQFDRTGNILNIQPVLPTSLNDHWLLINRFIVPLAYQPELAAGVGNTFGLGDVLYQGFLSPTATGNFSWGVGPAIAFPTATDTVLGTGKWSVGPAAVGIWSVDRIVTGALINNIWSIAGDGNRPDVSFLTFQPFFNYNLDSGWFLNTAPIITANWEAASGDVWTVPIGAGFGRVFAIGAQPVNLSAALYWNAIKPEGAAEWTLRLQMTLLFPQ